MVCAVTESDVTLPHSFDTVTNQAEFPSGVVVNDGMSVPTASVAPLPCFTNH